MHPSHLKAIVPLSGISDWYLNTIYHGGLESETIWNWAAETDGLAAGTTNPGYPVDMAGNSIVAYHAHPVRTSFWTGSTPGTGYGDIKDYYSQLTIPILEEDGWKDRYKDGMVRNFQALPSNVWLVLGPWTHATTSDSATGATSADNVDPNAPNLAFYDRFLMHLPAAPLPQQPLTAFEMPDGGAGTGWYQYPSWPPPGILTSRYSFNTDGTLATQSGSGSNRTFTDNGGDSGCDASSAATCNPAQAQAESSGYRSTFDTAPFTSDAVIANSSEVMVRVKFPGADDHIVVRMYDKAADGTLTQMATGWRRAQLRSGTYPNEDYSTTVPYDASTFVDVPVHVYPQYWRIAAGHQIEMSFSSGDWTDAFPDGDGGGIVTLATGQNGSYVDLSFLPAPATNVPESPVGTAPYAWAGGLAALVALRPWLRRRRQRGHRTAA
jgi:predicted acyl esterase